MVPSFLVPVALVIYTIVLLVVHRRMAWWIKLSLAIPALALAFMLFLASVNPPNLDITLRQNASRITGVAYFSWHIFFLWITRKHHR